MTAAMGISRVRKVLAIVIGTLVAVGLGAYLSFQLSPWPMVWLVRHSFDKGAKDAAASVVPRLPQGISSQRGLSYALGSSDTGFDVFAPATAQSPLPAVLWVHGGGFIAGSRADLSGYLQVLAARGYVTVAIDYSVAPEAAFPTPVRQTNLALSHVIANAKHFNIDPERIFLAGDSAGAQIVAQTALVISDASYAQQMGIVPGLARGSLRGLILYCGPYDPTP
jgi:acetyl esterase/lipase